MLESGSSGSVRGVLSNEHPYREPRPNSDAPGVLDEVRSRVQTRIGDDFRTPRQTAGNSTIELVGAGMRWQTGSVRHRWSSLYAA